MNNPTTCPKCQTAQIGSYQYCCNPECGVFWASLTTEAIARAEAHAAEMRAKMAKEQAFFRATEARLLSEKEGK